MNLELFEYSLELMRVQLAEFPLQIYRYLGGSVSLQFLKKCTDIRFCPAFIALTLTQQVFAGPNDEKKEKKCDFPQSYLVMIDESALNQNNQGFSGTFEVDLPEKNQSKDTLCVSLAIGNESPEILECKGSVSIFANKKGTSTTIEKTFQVSIASLEVSSRVDFDTLPVQFNDFGKGYFPSGVSYQLSCKPVK